MGKHYKEILNDITTFILDIDGVLTDGTVLVTTSGELLRNMNIKDGYALKTAIDKGYTICIISGGSNDGVRLRLEGLGIKEIHLGVKDKIQCLNTFLKQHSINPEHALYMGDDIPDYNVMQQVGLPACPQDAVPEIKAISKYISHKNGGNGAVRDVIEQTLKVQGNWMQNFSAKYD
ncbi:MAG: HAD-IIIA family hydrolase [Flavobacteriaceae bacterium]|nr:HAD-IIIA family hydrolase [Flavobacteriaceae bacterium]